MFPSVKTLFEGQFIFYQNQVPPEKQRVTKLKKRGRTVTVQPLSDYVLARLAAGSAVTVPAFLARHSCHATSMGAAIAMEE